MRIFAFHLLNDYSGSPKVLMQLAKGWAAHDLDVHLVSCTGREGFLSNIKGIQYHYFWYRFAENPVMRLFNLMLSQLLLILNLFSKIKKQDTIYINTVLPFGAAILGKLKGCRVIYHLHETTVRPAIFKRFLFGILNWAADEVIFVSDFLAKQEAIPSAKQHTLHNAIEDKFLKQAIENRRKHTAPKHVLMVCSLKDYKGVNEFVQLAQDNPSFDFSLVMNASQIAITDYFKVTNIPLNLKLHPTQSDLHSFYHWADIILNLSRPDGWIETFGLTIIEGMSYGLPAIIPPVGGVTELIEEGKNGLKIDSRNRISLNQGLQKILNNISLYDAMSQCARQRICDFSEAVFIQKSLAILHK